MNDLDAHPDKDVSERGHRAAALKERVYVVFTVLAVVIALRAHDAHASAGAALGSVVVAVVATIVAVYVADLISYMVVHERLPRGSGHRRMLAGTLGAGVVALPALVCIVLAVIGVYSVSTGLLAAMLITLVTLTGVGFVAVHNLKLRPSYKPVALLAEALLALGVIALELLSHI